MVQLGRDPAITPSLELFLSAGRRFTSAADFKGPVRAGREREGYSIIANMGD